MFLECYKYSLNIIRSQSARLGYSVSKIHIKFLGADARSIFPECLQGLAKLGPSNFLNDNDLYVLVTFLLISSFKL